jgi:exodeoxyribonuclease VII large subunit
LVILEPITISELTSQIREIIESNFTFVYVTGEISNFKKHYPSGHYYFSLKDESATINAVVWASRTKELDFSPDNGMEVIVKGRITLYPSSGRYQIDVFEMHKEGIGDLRMAFEKLKEKLRKEGIFDKPKKTLLKFPERIGLITSESGAVQQDFKKVATKRFPLVHILLFPVNVQGEGSALSIVNAIKKANDEIYNLDFIVIARGGGSIEDLWTFNEEIVVREIYNSRLPVISAIGHETDTTLSDYVADLSAPTPSAAAEIVLPDKKHLLERLKENYYNISELFKEYIESLYTFLENAEKNRFFHRPVDLLNEQKMKLDNIQDKISEIIKRHIVNKKQELKNIDKILHNINPDITLKRGFTYIKQNGKIIPRKKLLNVKDEVEINFYDGKLKSEIKSV